MLSAMEVDYEKKLRQKQEEIGDLRAKLRSAEIIIAALSKHLVKASLCRAGTGHDAGMRR